MRAIIPDDVTMAQVIEQSLKRRYHGKVEISRPSTTSILVCDRNGDGPRWYTISVDIGADE